ncbi:MAG TPA: signal peptide peptidase SppA [Chitinophagaceae bacterium]|nr:signal peptide peptidase SppA [Chitinophagaceae bacterium]
MKQFFKFFFASLLAMVIAIMLFFIVLFSVIGSIKSSFKNTFKAEEKSFTQSDPILKIDLSDIISEKGSKNTMALFTGGKVDVSGAYDLINAIEKAENDSKIEGIYIKTGGWASGMAIAEQLREALVHFKENTDKFIIAYGDIITQNDYYIVSAADQIYLHPMGGLEIKGLASQIMFFKGTLDKLGVSPEIFYAGQFKSATEPFRLKKMSEPNRLQLAAMQEIIWDEYLSKFSEFSKKSKEEIHEYALNGTIQTAYDAVREGLITGLAYGDEIEANLKKLSNLKEDADLKMVDLHDYAAKTADKKKSNQIALLIAEGNIVDGEGSSSGQEIADKAFIKQLRDIKKDKNIKALVIRINSGGGSALASEKMLREIKLLQEEGMPVVVSMGNVAASGGYYMASSADSIFAQPSTITGSIGVFGMMFNLSNLLENKIGVTFDTEKNAPHADFPSLGRNMSEREKQFIQNGVDTVYEIFKSRVAEGRNMDIAKVDSVGQGRVWMGTTALELGLIDALGGTQRAIQSAANLANITDYGVSIYPKVDDKLDQLLKGLSGSTIQESIIKENFLAKELGKDYRWYQFLKNMEKNRNKILTMMPYEIYFE